MIVRKQEHGHVNCGMDNKTKELLLQILANQVVLYKRLDDIENRVKGSSRLASIPTYLGELERKSEEILDLLRRQNP